MLTQLYRNLQWSITFLKTDTYTIQNFAFESFAGYVHQPRVRDEVLGKRQAKPWIIKSVDESNAYTWVENIVLHHIIDLQQHIAFKQRGPLLDLSGYGT